MNSWLRDIALAARFWLRSPGLALVAILTLAFGIGANVAIFILINAVFLRPPADVHEPDRVVALYSRDLGTSGSARLETDFLPVSYPNFEDFRQSADALDEVAAFCWLRSNLQRGDETDQVWGEIVTAEYFPLLGIDAHVGRLFTEAESGPPGAHPVVILGHGLWRRMFGADEGAIGETIRVNGHELTIVGVAPLGFVGVNHLAPKELWVPMAMSRQVFPYADFIDTRGFRMFNLVGRLAPGASIEQARAEAEAFGETLRTEFPEANEDQGLALFSLPEAMVDPNQRRKLEQAGVLLLVAVGLVLVIACGNLANLLLARAAARRAEMSVRLSLGASRVRLLRQLLTESALLALAGGALGVVIGAWSARLLWRMKPHYFPDSGLDLGIDPRVLLFALGVTALTGSLFGLVPALQASRHDLVGVLRNGPGAASDRVGPFSPRRLLVALQVSLCVIALVGAALFWRSLGNLLRVDTGFVAENMALLSYDLAAHEVGPPQGEAFHREALERVRALPLVAEAALGERFPLNAAGLVQRVVIEGDEASRETPHFIRSDSVSSGYFETLQLQLLAGERFDRTIEEGGRSVAIVNQTMAERFWNLRGAVGKRFSFADTDRSFEVIGVVADAKYVSVSEPPQPYIYLPLEQNYVSAATLFVRTRDDPLEAIPTLRAALRQIDRDLPIGNIMTGYGGPTTLSRVVDDSLWGQTLASSLLGSFGILALVLTVIGIFGVLGYTIQRRSREIGIRMALGAERHDVIRLILREGMTVVVIGLTLGVVGAFFGARISESLLYGLRPRDPLTFIVVVLGLALVAGATTFIQGWRATRVDPLRVINTS